MIEKLNIDFTERRAGEIILYRLSQQRNFTTEALIYLYSAYMNKVDLNSLKSQRMMYKSKASGGTTILHQLMERDVTITPNQIERLVKDLGFDITAKDNDNNSILHFAANGDLTASKLNVLCTLLKQKQKEQFALDITNKSGETPYQQYLYIVDTGVTHHMDTIATFEEWGADITQSEHGSASNMLHWYLQGDLWSMRMADIRKMCFDEVNPWEKQEKRSNGSHSSGAAKVDGTADANNANAISRYRIPLHVRPVPDGQTLARMYAEHAMRLDVSPNLNLIKYFHSKKEIRFELDSQSNPLWLYLRSNHVHLEVIKYLIFGLGCSQQPKPDDNIARHYINYNRDRNEVNWEILDYFYYDLHVDFKAKVESYWTLVHAFARYSAYFKPQDFKKFISRYELQDILIDAGSTEVTAFGTFMESRKSEIRPDILQCFKELGYDMNELVNNETPLHCYCNFQKNTYILPEIVQAFLDCGARIDYFPATKITSMAQVIANTDGRVSYDRLRTLRVMMHKYGIKLVSPKKKHQSIEYEFIRFNDQDNRRGTKFLEHLESLVRIFQSQDGFFPRHLIHNEKEDDKDKKVKYKLYRVDCDAGTEEFDKKLKKKVKEAKKYNGRMVFIRDERDGTLRSVRPLTPYSYDDWNYCLVPQQWLVPVTWKELQESLADMKSKYERFERAQLLAKSVFFIDMEVMKQIMMLIGNNKEMVNEIKPGDMSLLQRYMESNHPSQISADDIRAMKEMGIDFKYGYDASEDALREYCCDERTNGVLNKSVVEALIAGGCPINWDYEEDDEEDDADDDEKGNRYREPLKTKYTALQHYAQMKESKLEGFKILVECGADIRIESASNLTAVYYLLSNSEHVTAQFIEYLANECKFKFTQPIITTQNYQGVDTDTILFNSYLRRNKNINVDTIRALVEQGDCDANSRDDLADTNSIKAYIMNENVAKFDVEVIKTLVELGANLNEPDNEGVTPIQYLLKLKYTPLTKLMEYVCDMIKIGAKFKHILCDDPESIMDYKLYKLQNMRDGYEHFNGGWCTIEAWIYEGRGKKSKIQSAVALDETGANQTLYINIKRSNLTDVSKDMLMNHAKFGALFAKLPAEEEDDDDDDDDDDDEEQVAEAPKAMDVVEEELQDQQS